MRILCLELQNAYEKWLKYVKNKTKCKKHTMEKMWEKERKNV